MRSLRSLWIMYKHELRLYFGSPLVYFIGAVWLFLAGGFFALSMVIGINSGQWPPEMGPTLEPMVFLMLFFAPALTMRLISDEMRAGTTELLFTAPVRDWEIVVSKWLAVWTVFTLMMLLTAGFPLLLIWRGSPEIGLIVTGYLGLWLLGGATFAIGVLASSLTQYQPIAFMIGLGVLVFLLVAQSVTRALGGGLLTDIVRELGISGHYNNLITRAVIDPVDIAYFVGLIAISLFLATQALSTRRWST